MPIGVLVRVMFGHSSGRVVLDQLRLVFMLG